MTFFFYICLEVSLVILILSMVMTMYRVLRGPRAGDRIVAADLFTVLAVAFIALFAIHIDQVVFLDAAIALALVAFFATVAYARFLEHKAAVYNQKMAETPEKQAAEDKDDVP
ncbi:monovalent cation/H+ antiporter complex subunit F [Niveispirillum fermenti]|uniref:monovalent cation/H+ antiporter complex subunit F n=1 Tax=Niveispirillum fermenti TaxID=1233113 RepID=UPI003A879A5C